VYDKSIVRKVDNYGRILIPKEIRDRLTFQGKESVRIYTDKNKIILLKNEPGCIFCHHKKNLVVYKNKLICNKCIKNINSKI